ncbi:MAG: hypothetical protein PUJ09_06770 [Eubacteriales bacterium]|nr:hypothetical protein [Eubacteriales bacterium]
MDKIPEGDIKEKSPFLQWLDNYWYHYKMQTIVVLVALFVIIVCVLQTCTHSESYDMSVLYSGRCGLTQNEASELSGVLRLALSEDYNGDGKKTVELAKYHVMSEEQMRQMASETHEDSMPVYVDRNFYAKEYENYSNMLVTGEYSVCMLDPWLYEKLASAGRLKKLSEVLTAVPDGAVGDYGVSLGSTGLYKYYDAMRVLPEDTVVCLMQPYVIGKSSKAEHYSRCIEMFRNIVEFKSRDM